MPHDVREPLFFCLWLCDMEFSGFTKRWYCFWIVWGIALAGGLPAWSAALDGQAVSLIPYPSSLQMKEGVFPLARLTTVSFPKRWEAAGRVFMKDLSDREALKVVPARKHAALTVREKRLSRPEAYRLEIFPDRIVVETADDRGLHHALATLQQLILGAEGGNLPLLRIEDHPRYKHRGLMLDCSRHFWKISELKSTIDQMAFFKLNAIHLHLTDNQAWRLGMERYPQLARKGTFYADFPELSGNYYTPQELKDLVAYAAERGVEIIPEVDLPGHSLALLAGMPSLSCRGGEFEAYPEEEEYGKRKRVGENMLCIGNPALLSFVEELVDALCDIFPSPYIHLGGDEVSTSIWETCPKCMALYRANHWNDLHEIQDYFTRAVSRVVRSKGKTMMGWDEINERGAASPRDVLTIWRDDGAGQRQKALERNIPVVMCPKDPCYFDFGYARNPTRKLYAWDPIDDQVPVGKRSLVLGGQACLWTEFVTTQADVERMFYPRLCALAEVLWSEPDKRDWNDFKERLRAFYPVMRRLGIHYYEGDTLSDGWFEAEREHPALKCPAQVRTNIRAIRNYDPEYAFDGREDTFFASSFATGSGDYFEVELGRPLRTGSVRVVCDDSKEFLDAAELQVSEDGHSFKKIADFDQTGASASFEAVELKAIRIVITGKNFRRLVIREIRLNGN